MTPDRQTPIDGLDADLAHEYQAVVSSIRRPMLEGFFEMEIPGEPAQFLASKTTASGEMSVAAPALFTLEREATARLREVLGAEAETSTRYAERRQQAEAFADYSLATGLDTLLSGETRHEEGAAKLLRGLSA